MSKVLLAGENPAFLAMLRDLFEAHREFSLCGQAQIGAEAVSKAERLEPSLIILDFSDFAEGLRTAEKSKENLPTVQLFLLVEGPSFELEKEAVPRGIDAVFSKDEGFEPLLSNARAACGLGLLGKKQGKGRRR